MKEIFKYSQIDNSPLYKIYFLDKEVDFEWFIAHSSSLKQLIKKRRTFESVPESEFIEILSGKINGEDYWILQTVGGMCKLYACDSKEYECLEFFDILKLE